MPEDTLPHDLPAVWEQVRAEARAGLPRSTFDLWIEPMRPVSAQAGSLYVAAPDPTREWVERRYVATLQRALRALDCGLERIVLVSQSSATPEPFEPSSAGVESVPLDPRHTFERFVIGSGNRLPHAAALAVAELPGEAYNPLFLHGPPGLGKTHLLGAIVDYLRRQRPELTVHYTTAERFTTEFVGALRRDGPDRFKQRYRKLDALLIDDVQALEGKDRTQEEFVHTFNALHAAGKQIVLSSDRPPEALSRLADRLRDRFEWGLASELGPPDLRTRTALLWRMTVEGALEIPEPTVLREIASLAAGNVRRLEGAMTRVAALSSVLSEPVTPSLVRRALVRGDLKAPPSSQRPSQGPTVAMIQEATCATLAVSREELLSPRRTARIIRARQLAIYLCRELTSLSLAQIAREFDRDHTTILHAIRNVSSRLEPGSETADALHRTRLLLAPPAEGTPASRGLTHHRDNPPPTPSTTSSAGTTP